jgi:hypothetical protein
MPVVSLYDSYEDLHFMQDGALPHFAWLDSHITGGWLGRCGPTLWLRRAFFWWCQYRSNVRT